MLLHLGEERGVSASSNRSRMQLRKYRSPPTHLYRLSLPALRGAGGAASRHRDQCSSFAQPVQFQHPSFGQKSDVSAMSTITFSLFSVIDWMVARKVEKEKGEEEKGWGVKGGYTSFQLITQRPLISGW